MKKLLMTQRCSASKHIFIFLIKAVEGQNHEKYDDAKTFHLSASRDHLKYEVFQTILIKYVKNV